MFRLFLHEALGFRFRTPFFYKTILDANACLASVVNSWRLVVVECSAGLGPVLRMLTISVLETQSAWRPRRGHSYPALTSSI